MGIVLQGQGALHFREESHYPKVLDSLYVILYSTFWVRVRAFSNCGSCSAVFFIPGPQIPPPQFSPQFATPAAAADILECGGLPRLFRRQICTPAKHLSPG